MRRYGFQLTEHNPEKPWLIIDSRHEEIELADDESFFRWAAQNYPRERYSVDVDPWTLSPDAINVSKRTRDHGEPRRAN